MDSEKDSKRSAVWIEVIYNTTLQQLRCGQIVKSESVLLGNVKTFLFQRCSFLLQE